MSRSRITTCPSPWISTSSWSSGVKSTRSPVLTFRTLLPTPSTSPQASRRATCAVAGITMPPLLRRSPSSGDSRTSTRSCSIWISSFAPSDTVRMLLGGFPRQDQAQLARPVRPQPHRHAPVLTGDPARGVLTSVVAARGLRDHLQLTLGDRLGVPELARQIGAGADTVGQQRGRRRADLQARRRAEAVVELLARRRREAHRKVALARGEHGRRPADRVGVPRDERRLARGQRAEPVARRLDDQQLAFVLLLVLWLCLFGGVCGF